MIKTISNKIIFIFYLLICLVSCARQTTSKMKVDNINQTNDSQSVNNTTDPINDKSFDLLEETISYLNYHGKNFLPNVNISILSPNNIESDIDILSNNDSDMYYIEIDSNNYYFACAFCDISIDDIRVTINDVIWKGYKNEKDIPKYYQNKKIVLTIQINKASNIINFTDKNSNDNFEFDYMSLFYTSFGKDNLNTKDHIIINEELVTIYNMNNTVKENYVAIFNYGNKLTNFDILQIDDQYYISIKKTIYSDDNISYDFDLKLELGNYYNDLLEIVLVQNYIEYKNESQYIEYLLIKIDDFVDLINRYKNIN